MRVCEHTMTKSLIWSFRHRGILPDGLIVGYMNVMRASQLQSALHHFSNAIREVETILADAI